MQCSMHQDTSDMRVIWGYREDLGHSRLLTIADPRSMDATHATMRDTPFLVVINALNSCQIRRSQGGATEGDQPFRQN